MNLFKNVFSVLQIVCVLLAVNSCSKIDELESRVVTLEKTVSELQSLVNSGYVVTNYSQNDDGWVLSLSNGTGASKTLNIYNGKDGVNGSDGKDGVNGQNGKDGDSFFADLKVNNGYITITLTDGTVFNIPLEDSSAINKINSLLFLSGGAGNNVVVQYLNTTFDRVLNSSFTVEFKVFPKSAASALVSSLANLKAFADFYTGPYSISQYQTVEHYGTAEATSISVDGDILRINFIDSPCLLACPVINNGEYIEVHEPRWVSIRISDNAGNEISSNMMDTYDRILENYLEYAGQIYKISYQPVTSNRFTWVMDENLRYVPDGYVPSSDVQNTNAAIYYPVVWEDDSSSRGGHGSFGTSEEDVKSLGLLYRMDLALGVKAGTSFTQESAKLVECTKGICPSGWHVPSINELDTWLFDLFKGPYDLGKPAGYIYLNGTEYIGFCGVDKDRQEINKGRLGSSTIYLAGSDAYVSCFEYDYTRAYSLAMRINQYAVSVRCIKDY